MARGALGLLLVAGSVACGHRPSAPGDALGLFAAAVERRDFRAAYALMSDAYRRRVPFDEFVRRLEAAGPEAVGTARALRESAAQVGRRIEIPIGEEERLPLVSEGGGWRLEESPFEPFRQDTPRAALKAFVRAATGRRYDVLLQLAPARHRSGLTIEKLRAFWEGPEAAGNRKLLAALRLALEGRIVEEGDDAFLFYGNGSQVRFVREEGLWRIESPE
jgi:hypothetical protein